MHTREHVSRTLCMRGAWACLEKGTRYDQELHIARGRRCELSRQLRAAMLRGLEIQRDGCGPILSASIYYWVVSRRERAWVTKPHPPPTSARGGGNPAAARSYTVPPRLLESRNFYNAPGVAK